MRTLAPVLLLVMSTAAWAGETERSPRADVHPRELTKEQLEHHAAPYFPEIRACYLAHGRSARNSTGELSLRLLVHHGGAVERFAIEAPGVVGANLRELTRCVRKIVETWQFPACRNPTTAILPYYFHYLDLPSGGPQLSCWNPKGCPDKTQRRTN